MSCRCPSPRAFARSSQCIVGSIGGKQNVFIIRILFVYVNHRGKNAYIFKFFCLKWAMETIVLFGDVTTTAGTQKNRKFCRMLACLDFTLLKIKQMLLSGINLFQENILKSQRIRKFAPTRLSMSSILSLSNATHERL